jgi:hypothetical protein
MEAVKPLKHSLIILLYPVTDKLIVTKPFLPSILPKYCILHLSEIREIVLNMKFLDG